jgi:hypothetical protein
VFSGPYLCFSVGIEPRTWPVRFAYTYFFMWGLFSGRLGDRFPLIGGAMGSSWRLSPGPELVDRATWGTRRRRRWDPEDPPSRDLA